MDTFELLFIKSHCLPVVYVHINYADRLNEYQYQITIVDLSHMCVCVHCIWIIPQLTYQYLSCLKTTFFTKCNLVSWKKIHNRGHTNSKKRHTRFIWAAIVHTCCIMWFIKGFWYPGPRHTTVQSPKMASGESHMTGWNLAQHTKATM